MDINNMKAHLIKWHPEWNIKTINKWRPNQILAIYMKEKDKEHIIYKKENTIYKKENNNVNYQQPNFF